MGLLKFYYNPYYLGYTHVKNNNKGTGASKVYLSCCGDVL